LFREGLPQIRVIGNGVFDEIDAIVRQGFGDLEKLLRSECGVEIDAQADAIGDFGGAF